jgi:hypothetical protein
LTILDVGPFSAYCSAYAHWRQAEEALQRSGELTIKTADGHPPELRANPPHVVHGLRGDPHKRVYSRDQGRDRLMVTDNFSRTAPPVIESPSRPPMPA